MSIGTLSGDDDTGDSQPAPLQTATSRSTTIHEATPLPDAALSALEALQATVEEQAELIRSMETLLLNMDERLQKLERDLGV